METQNHDARGIWYGIMAYAAWGVLPLYWKLLNAIPAMEILAHRIFWSFIFVSMIIVFTGGRKALQTVLSNKKSLLLTCLCGVLISFNWFTYIWAVNSDRVIEASMGYFINPLVVVLLSVTVLKEKMTRGQAVAIGLAATGVLILTVQYGQVPVTALILAGTFALYGLVKKMVDADSLSGLMLETMVVMPVALVYILSRQIQGVGAVGNVPPLTVAILFAAGVATATPLLLFVKGVQKIKFSTIGFLQYLTPTINLILGIFVFKEYFSVTHFVSFGFIWAGILVYLSSNIALMRHNYAMRQKAAPLKRAD